MLGTCLENVRNTVPLVHNITNYVTVNDVANILLACGGSPIMSDEPEDVEDITSICGGLNINIGTLNQRSIEGMFRAGAKANAMGHVVLLDPVGAGASALRTNTAVKLMEKIKFTVIRGNISEIKTLALGSGTTKTPRDGQDHRHGLPALRHDDGLCRGKSRQSAGGRRGGGLRHGPGGRDRLERHAGWRR